MLNFCCCSSEFLIYFNFFCVKTISSKVRTANIEPSPLAKISNEHSVYWRPTWV